MIGTISRHGGGAPTSTQNICQQSGARVFFLEGPIAGAVRPPWSGMKSWRNQDMKSWIALAGLVLSLWATSNVQAEEQAALGVVMSGEAGARGAVITSVYAGSPAAQIGLTSGDRILAINAQPVRD